MSYEMRRGKRYYYCVRRVNGRLVKSYLGRGAEAEQAAAEVARHLTDQTGVTISPRDVLESPYSLIGSVPELVDKLIRTRQRWGINSFLIGWFDEPRLRDIAPVVEQLAEA